MPQEAHSSPPIPAGPHGKKVGQYRVYWNQAQHRKVMILQFPNRKKEDAPNSRNGNKPLEIRLKPASGLVEVDIPIKIDKSYDRARGLQYGQALQQSRTLQNKGDYGFAGGFGTHPPPKSSRGSTHNLNFNQNDEMILDDFEHSITQGHVLNKMTLGGRIRACRAGDPVYALGAFHGDELHLTKVDAICTLQPQFHQLDAIADNERLSSRAAAAAEQPESEARAVNMAVKSTEDEELDMSEIGKTLRSIQEERWQRLDWIDEEDDLSYMTYQRDLKMALGSKGRQLISTMTEAQYLDAISAPRVDPIRRRKNVLVNQLLSSYGDGELSSTDDDDNDVAKDAHHGDPVIEAIVVEK